MNSAGWSFLGVLCAAALSSFAVFRVHAAPEVRVRRDLEILVDMQEAKVDEQLLGAWKVRCERGLLELNLKDSRYGYLPRWVRLLLGIEGVAICVVALSALWDSDPGSTWWRFLGSLALLVVGGGACWAAWVMHDAMKTSDKHLKRARGEVRKSYEDQKGHLDGVEIRRITNWQPGVRPEHSNR